jgi:hypothetical protein
LLDLSRIPGWRLESSLDHNTPLPLGIDFGAISHPKTDEEKVEALKILYKELIGSLMFTAIVSCLDISYSVGKLAQYSLNPRCGHWNLAK